MLMLKRFPALLILPALLALPVRTPAAEPANLSLAKEAVMKYHASGEYGEDLAKVAVKAGRYLAKRLAKPLKPDEKRAIVFDIDETTLTNLSHMAAQDFGYVEAVWNKWVNSGQCRAIVPVQLIYDLAVRQNVDVFFITSRKPDEAPSTERNLRETGYAKWTRVYYRPVGSVSARQFKVGIRRQLVEQGYTIVLNIGDQQSDLAGGFAERSFKLPNPFYLVR